MFCISCKFGLRDSYMFLQWYGVDDYAEMWLQLAFPVYLVLIAAHYLS